MGVVSVAFIVCWLPHFIVVVAQYWNEEMFIEFSMRSPTTYDIITTVINNILPTLNSCVNPFIYGLFSEQFRYDMIELLF